MLSFAILLCLASSLAAGQDKRMLLDGSSQDLLAKYNDLNRRMALMESSFQECQCPLKSAPVVAFKAHLLKNMPSVGAHQHIIFEDIKLNIGNAYNKFSGTFTAPVNGTYMLSVTICSASSHYIYVDLMRNTDLLGQVLAGDAGTYSDCSSETTVAQLTAGDSVFVKHTGTSGDYIYSGDYNSFTGTLLRAL